MLKALSGYKSYFIAFAVAVVAGLHQLGYINNDVSTTILTFLGAGAVASLKSAISKVS